MAQHRISLAPRDADPRKAPHAPTLAVADGQTVVVGAVAQGHRIAAHRSWHCHCTASYWRVRPFAHRPGLTMKLSDFIHLPLGVMVGFALLIWPAAWASLLIIVALASDLRRQAHRLRAAAWHEAA